MADCDIIAFHGWGFGPRCWKLWETNLSKFGTFQTYDRGYFGSSNGQIRLPATDRRTVLIAHSFGLHWINETLLNNANLVIILGGFLQFHPVAAQYKRRSRTILRKMINQFEVYPEKVLRNFYTDCYAPQEVENKEIGELNHQLLLDDLKWLDESLVAAENLKNVSKICIIHGADDHIVPKSKGREVFNQLSSNARYFEIKNAGHAIPITHHTQCLELIYPGIELLKNKKDQL